MDTVSTQDSADTATAKAEAPIISAGSQVEGTARHVRVTTVQTDVHPIGRVSATAPEVPMKSPVDRLYTAFTDVFGNDNPMQMFSLVWPGTVLDSATYRDARQPGDPLDPLLEINQSILFNQFYPIAPITQPDGTRVSDRYRSAIESFGPKPNPALLTLQALIRQRLDQPTTIDVNGQRQTVSLLEKYSILQQRWIDKKQDWSRRKEEKLDFYRNNGAADWWGQYINWYENTADGYIAAIDAAYNLMRADFPVAEFEDALAILDTHDAAALLRAKQEMRDAEIPVPANIGASFYSTQAFPGNWGNALKPSSTFRDLLADPEAQQRYMQLCIDQLREQIFSWNAVLAQIPDSNKADIESALKDFHDASESYFNASSQLQKDYGDNTVLAVKTYMQYKQGSDAEKQAQATVLRDKLNAANDKPAGPPIDWGKVAEQINDANKKLVDDTGSMVKQGQALGEKASAYLNSRAGEGLRALIAPVLSKLQSQLTTLVDQISNFNSAASKAIQINGVDAQDTAPHPLRASPVDDEFSKRWSEISFALTSENMSTESQSSTSFEQTNWGVSFFFGSAGGQSKKASEEFASKYMDDKSTIQIGMLATKVIIERPWMHPELFGMSKGFFKAVDTPVSAKANMTKGELLSTTLGGGVSQKKADENCVALGEAILPGYPVALLLVKDVTIKMSLKATQTVALQKHAEQNSSNGGGFLCFSVSKTQSSTADSKSVASYVMGGEFVFRIPAPQVVGVWNQILPQDRSEFLTADNISRVLQFKQLKKQAQALGSTQAHVERKPEKPL